MIREQFSIQLLEFQVLENESLLICTNKHLGLYNYGNDIPFLIINDYKLSLPILGAYKYKYTYDSNYEYLPIARYRGTSIYTLKNELLISNHLPFPVLGIVVGGFLYAIYANILKVVHLYTLESAQFDINGTLFKTKKGAFIQSNDNCLYKITIKEYFNIQQILCQNDLYPVALDCLNSHQHPLDHEQQSIYIKKRFISYLLTKQQYDKACLLMMDVDYPLNEFIQHFPEIVPHGLNTSSLQLNTSHHNNAVASINNNSIFPFLTYLSSKRAQYPIIDTIMFYIYSKINTSILESLIRVENSCDLTVCGPILINNNMISTWILLYFSKQEHLAALEYMQLNKFDSKYFLEYFDLLININQTDWLFAHLTYFLKTFRALDYFINHTSLQTREVYYKMIDLLAFDVYLKREYLSKIAIKSTQNKTEFYTKLILVQIQIIHDLCATNSIEEDSVLQQRLILRDYLQKTTTFDNSPILIDQLRALTLDFEIALVYKTLNYHQEALKIYIFKMKNYSEALRYCFDVYHHSNELNVYMDLYHIIQQYEPDKVLEFIKEYADYLDPLTVLTSIAEEVPCVEVAKYMNRGILQYQKQFQKASLVKNQLKIQHSRLRQERYYEMSQFCTIDAYKVCYHCNRRIGD